MKEELTKRELVAEKFYWLGRLGVLLAALLTFFPAFNPERICSYINKNVSLFTAAVAPNALTGDVGTGFRFGTVTRVSFDVLRGGSVLALLAVILFAVFGCMSLGNRRLRRLGNIFGVAGAAFMIGGLSLTYVAKNMIQDSIVKNSATDYVSTYTPVAFWVFAVIAILIVIAALAAVILLPKVDKGVKYAMETKYKLFLILLPFLALVFVFAYLPLWGWRYSFFDYKPGEALTSANFVGFKWFSKLLEDPATRNDVIHVIRNTLAMSGLGLLTSWLPMAFAIFLNEMKSKWFRRIVQVFTTVPNFVSWVLVYSLAFAMFSTDGFVNQLLGTNTPFLMHEQGTWFKMLAWGIWKGIGWSAIIYIAGITGIDPQLYEAATVDGAGRTQKMWHITVPGLLPTFFVLLLMSVANILTNGMDQYLVFSNANNKDLINVLDLYVYKLGLESSNTIPLSTVVSMTKSVISVILLFAANGVSKLIRGESIM